MKYKQKLYVGCGRPNIFSSSICNICYKEIADETKSWDECLQVMIEWEKNFPNAVENVGKGAKEMLKHWQTVNENT